MKALATISTIFYLFYFSLSFGQTSGYRLGTIPKQTYQSVKNLPVSSRLKVTNLQDQISALNGKLAKADEADKSKINSEIKTYQNEIDKIKKNDSTTYYQTLEWIEIERIDGDIVSKKKDISTKMDQLQVDVTDRKLTPAQIATLNDECKQLESDINELTETKDSLYKIYMTDYVSQDRAIFLFGPNRARAFFNLMYDQDKTISFAQTAGLNFGENSGSIYSELVSGNMGLVRIGFGVMVSQSNESDSTQATQQDAYQRLASNGGNTVLKIEYPLIFLHSRNFQYNFVTKANYSLAADLPAFGTRTSSFAGNTSFGIESYIDVSADFDKKTKKTPFRFFTTLSINGYSGTKQFQENLGLNRSNFLYGQLSVGILIAQTIKISAVLHSFSSEHNLRGRGVIVGGQVLPTF